LTIVLAVAVTRNWRSSLAGAASGAATLAILVLLLGPSLGSVPITFLQVGVGILLLFFGTRWLRKAILRGAGIIGLHDEAAIFARQTEKLRSVASAGRGIDGLAVLTSFKAVLIEGLEVVFIVVAVGAAGKLLVPASIGALAAGLTVVTIGVVVHRPLARVPENLLKLAVGVLLSAFGVFWIGEGLRYTWPGGDWAIVAMIGGFLTTALLMIPIIRQRSGQTLAR
jgi:Ca2+/H+ antiporter, TMEM165/GDT1 family